ncbi:hypothetical protein P3G55_24505 [Leptospira sp. 96542]|nr:hypothetical protein [Leptospira sp. 96542]
MKVDLLRTQYSENFARAERLREALVEQLTKLLDQGQIALGVPIESRVKAWTSIEEKLERKSLVLDDITALSDLIGIRVILLFRADLEAVEKLIAKTFDILSSEDTAKRLGEAQFGYQSQHYVLRLPKPWLHVPSMADLGDLQVEVQVRTLAQHIWAAASHKLQYKHEASVPPPLRRTISRVSALLETVDLEFDRVLAERNDYRETGIPATSGSEPLNVDLLASLLADRFPPANRMDDEDYETLLSDLKHLSVDTVDKLKRILDKNRDHALEDERNQVASRQENSDYSGTTKRRIESGVYYAHVGLTRAALRAEFGDKADKIFLERLSKTGKGIVSHRVSGRT